MIEKNDGPEPAGFDQFKGDLRKAERKVAGEIDPGARAVVVAVAVLVVILSFVLPHTGSVNGIDVVTFSADAASEKVTITSRVFVFLQLIFGVCFSVLALLTRRWFFAWIALCGSAVSCFAGLLAWWSRNTPGVSGVEPPSGVGIGLIIGWLAMFVITFHWARVVWARTNYQLALEAQRRNEAAAEEERALALQRRTAERRRDRDPSDGGDR
jgi:signal transduction histidine kinase